MVGGMKGGIRGRIGLTVYYGFVCALAVRRCGSILSGRGRGDSLSYLHMALYAALALSGWWLLRELRETRDRLAACLFGLFYAIRVGACFVRGVDASMPLFVECAVILAGMIAMILGLKEAISRGKVVT